MVSSGLVNTLFALILAPGEGSKTLTLRSQVFIGQFVTDWNAVLSALSMAIFPVMVLYVIFSRQLIRVLVAGLGNMGRSHALVYHAHAGAQIVGLVNRSNVDLPDALQTYPRFKTFEEGMATNPDLVCIATYSDSHAAYAIAAMEAGADVFIEKSLATTAKDAQRVVETATKLGRKLVAGYILHHPPVGSA